MHQVEMLFDEEWYDAHVIAIDPNPETCQVKVHYVDGLTPYPQTPHHEPCIVDRKASTIHRLQPGNVQGESKLCQRA